MEKAITGIVSIFTVANFGSMLYELSADKPNQTLLWLSAFGFVTGLAYLFISAVETIAAAIKEGR